MNKPTVAVLMSTYNGEKYIREQIDSILAQKDVDVTLFIRDDGSTDDTLKIISEYVSKYSNIHLYCDGKNVRPGKSFLKLLCYVVKYKEPFDYYAFSDQDDIWLEQKLAAGVEAIKDLSRPALYCSNQIIYQDGERKQLRFEEPQKLDLMNHLSNNDISGCTMVLNNELACEILNREKPSKRILDVRCHDTWVILMALVIGDVVYDHDSYILYRIHNDNVVGIKERSFSQRLKRFFNSTVKNIRRDSARYLLNSLAEIDFAEKDHIEKMAYYDCSIMNRFFLIKNAGVYKTAKESKLVFIIKTMINYI